MVNYFPYLLNYLNSSEFFPVDQIIPELRPLYSFILAYKFSCQGNLQQASFLLQSARDSPFINPYSLKQHQLNNPLCYDKLFLAVNSFYLPNDPWRNALSAIILETKGYITPNSSFVSEGISNALQLINKAVSLSPHVIYKLYKAFISRDFDNKHLQLVKDYFKEVEPHFLNYYQPLFDLTFYHLSFLKYSDYSPLVAMVTNFISFGEIDLLSEGIKKISSHLTLTPLAFTDLYFASRDMGILANEVISSSSFNLEQVDHVRDLSLGALSHAMKELEKHGRERYAISIKVMINRIAGKKTDEFLKYFNLMKEIQDVAYKDYVYFLYQGASSKVKEELCNLPELKESCKNLKQGQIL